MINDQLFEEPELYPFVDKVNVSFKCPNSLSHEKYVEHINNELPPETPLAFGMHPNSEIDFRTMQLKALFAILVKLPFFVSKKAQKLRLSVFRFIMLFKSVLLFDVTVSCNTLNLYGVVSRARCKRSVIQPLYFMNSHFVSICRFAKKSLVHNLMRDNRFFLKKNVTNLVM
jgi:hypothetical protein